MMICRLVIALVCLVHAGPGWAERVWFPNDSGVIDVTKTPYQAVPDDGLDDSKAIQQAFNDHPSGNHVFYFPSGVYDLSDELMKRPDGDALANRRACIELRGTMKRNIIVGASEKQTVLRLMDSVPESFEGGLIWFGPKPAQRFRNALRTMTLSIGTGHPGASGVFFNASNQGGLRSVTILSEDPEGRGDVGLHLAHTDEIGPMLAQDVTIQGFEIGIRCAFQTASQTFERITLRGQRSYGWTNGFSQSVFARGVEFQGGVTAIRSGPTVSGDPGQARLLLVDANLACTEKGTQLSAVRNQKAAFLRNVVTSGFRTVVTRELDHGRGNPTVLESPLSEFIANGAGPGRKGEAFMLFDSPARSLNLPTKNPPRIEWEQDPQRWASPTQFIVGQSGRADDGFDDTPSIQAAIDSGASTVYLPRGTWRVSGTIKLRKNVRHFLGCEARLNPLSGAKGANIALSSGKHPAVLVEGLEAGGVIFTHQSPRVLHLRSLLGGRYESPKNSLAGDLYLTDFAGGPVVIGKGQRLWARQLNVEGDTQSGSQHEAKLFNRGGTAWVFGMKTEDGGTVIKTTDGGSTELLGHLHVGRPGESPCFVTVDSRFSAALSNAGSFPVAAMETRGGVLRTAKSFEMADLYVAYPEADLNANR